MCKQIGERIGENPRLNVDAVRIMMSLGRVKNQTDETVRQTYNQIIKQQKQALCR